MKALVTGGGGFLGGAIARELTAQGHAVVSLQRSAVPELASLGVECVPGDIADADTVARAARGCDVVFHVAAKAGSWGSYESYFNANVLGTGNVLAACRAHGIGRLVHTSTPSVVHRGGDLEGVDESTPYAEHFLAHYPATKLIAEHAVLSANGPELATVALRPHLIWGPGDQHLLPRILDRARRGRLRFIGIAGKRIDATYIDNAAAAHLNAAATLAPGSAHAGKAYFISNGEPLSVEDMINRLLACADLPATHKRVSLPVAYAVGALLELVYRVLRLEGEPILTRFVAEQLGTAHWFDIGAAKRDFGYVPQVSMEQGFARLRAHLAGVPGLT